MAASKTLTASQRVQRARIAAYAQKVAHDPRETTKAGTAAFLEKFAVEIDPEHELPEAERQRRAIAARKQYMAQLAFQSSRSRQAKKAGGAPS